MGQVGGFQITNRVSGQKTLNPGVNQGNTSFAQPFIYEVAQVENVVLNEDSGADSLGSRTAALDRADAAKTAGRVQFRILPAYQTVARKDLPWADPITPYQSINLEALASHWAQVTPHSPIGLSRMRSPFAQRTRTDPS